MQTLSGFSYFEVRFGKQGELLDPAEVSAVVDHVRNARPTDLFVVSHGWNNDMQEARQLYEHLCKRLRFVIEHAAPQGLDGRTFAVLGVLWPSKKFADKDLIPGGAASLVHASEGTALKLELRNLRDAFDAPDAERKLERAEELVDHLDDDPAAQAEYVRIMRELLPEQSGSDEKQQEVPQELYADPGPDLLARLSDEDEDEPADRGLGGAANVGGGAAGLGGLFGNLKLGGRRLLNFVTYYQMKERAGTVGSSGVNQVLRQILQAEPRIRLHLVGHSFGGRLLTAAAAAAEPGTITTLTLLQAAFSHHGFSAARNGFFRTVVADGRVRGPILITHTPNDTAVGIAYPIASRLGGQRAAYLGGRNDPFGGIGRNGAVDSEATEGSLLPLNGTYTLQPGKLHNLSADDFISDHGDVTDEEVAYAILTSVGTT